MLPGVAKWMWRWLCPDDLLCSLAGKTTKNNCDLMLLSNRLKTGPVRQMLASAALLFGSTSVAAPEGDINLDGAVNVVDVLQGLQVLHGNRSLNTSQLEQGDLAPLLDGWPQPDGTFNLADALLILRVALGLVNFSYPGNQFNIGDSIGEGEEANGTIGDPNHETVWSTGYAGGDSVDSFNERLEQIDAPGYYENTNARDSVFNHADSGAVMADFVTQAQAVVSSTAQVPGGAAGMVTVFLGNNDVCADTLADMTDPVLFETQYRAGLDVLSTSPATRSARISVSGIPAIYWLWEAKRSNLWCRLIWAGVPCQNLLAGAGDDCASSASRNDPDMNYPGDGSNCLRRKAFHRTIRDTYNPILRDVLAEYRDNRQLPNATYTDIYDVRFESVHVNGGDCFHPSEAGHALLAAKEWCRAPWGSADAQCASQ